jgi:predicted phage terminase large subunit-like protein
MEYGQKIGCVQSFHKTDMCATISTRDGGTAQINFRSADKPENLRGPNLSGCVFDEASLYDEDAPMIVIACLREAGEMGWLSMAFTPKGKGHWTYGWFFDKKNGNPQPDTELFRASTKDNPYLAKRFYETVLRKYVAGSTLARQELEGEFVDLSGLLFQWTWFNRVEAVPAGGVRVRYWDKAGTEGDGDYSAGVLLCRANDGFWYVEDVIRGQWSPRRRNEIIRAVAQRDAARYDNQVTIWVEQEPGSGGKESAILTVQDLAAYPVYIEPVRGDKVIRSRPFQAQCEAGNVRVRDARWTEEFLDELCGFPESKHDDQVDAVCGAYNKIAMGLGFDYSGDLVAYPEMPKAAKQKQAQQQAQQQIQQHQDGQLPIDVLQAAGHGDQDVDLLEYLREYAGVSAGRGTARQRLLSRFSGN